MEDSKELQESKEMEATKGMEATKEMEVTKEVKDSKEMESMHEEERREENEPMEGKEGPANIRAEELDLRERRLYAREVLHSLRLPPELLAQVDISSTAALEKAIGLMKAMQRLLPRGEAPKAHREGPINLNDLSYQQRAALYLQDKQSYESAKEGGR